MEKPLRILQVHNAYRPGWGGEDSVAALEADLLRQHDHHVERLVVSTAELDHANMLRIVSAGFGTVWSTRGYFALKRAIADFSPDIIHVHNTFPLLSPSIFWAAGKAGIPAVQTLHNFRLTCANGLLLRNDQPCQDCVGRFPWSAFHYRCYGRSFARTATVAAANVFHQWLGTFRDKVQAYIVLTEFSKAIMVRSGLPEKSVFVKPNFTFDGIPPIAQRRSRVVFVGSVSRHKGIHLLLESWRSTVPGEFQLLLVGDGPDRVDMQTRYAGDPSVIWCGSQSHDRVMEIIAASRLLVIPSICYENLPMSLVEALSVGTPVIVPNHGAFPSLVYHRQEGLLFAPGDAVSLGGALSEALACSEGTWTQWSKNARKRYSDEFSSQRNYEQLISIYRQVIDCFRTAYPGKKTISQRTQS